MPAEDTKATVMVTPDNRGASAMRMLLSSDSPAATEALAALAGSPVWRVSGFQLRYLTRRRHYNSLG